MKWSWKFRCCVALGQVATFRDAVLKAKVRDPAVLRQVEFAEQLLIEAYHEWLKCMTEKEAADNVVPFKRRDG